MSITALVGYVVGIGTKMPGLSTDPQVIRNKLIGAFTGLRQPGADLISETTKFPNEAGQSRAVQVRDLDEFAIQPLQFVRTT